MGRKTQFLREILRNFRKFSKNFLNKIATNALFSNNFFKLTKHELIFRAFGRKIQIVGKF